MAKPVECVECGAMISRRAKACPACGCPQDEDDEDGPEAPPTRGAKASKLRGCGCGCLTLIVAGVLATIAVDQWLEHVRKAREAEAQRAAAPHAP